MPRRPRIVVPDYPHHVIQRGARRMPVFFQDSDYKDYLRIITKVAVKEQVDILAYCLMPNHVHFICVPKTADGLARLFREAHRKYSTMVNRREDWVGNLWQGRFTSIVMDERHTLIAARYIELNPVKARIVRNPARYKWSSASAHLSETDDGIVSTQPLARLVPDWERFLSDPTDEVSLEDQLAKLEGQSGCLGSDTFIERLENKLSTSLRTKSQGRPKKVTE